MDWYNFNVTDEYDFFFEENNYYNGAQAARARGFSEMMNVKTQPVWGELSNETPLAVCDMLYGCYRVNGGRHTKPAFVQLCIYWMRVMNCIEPNTNSKQYPKTDDEADAFVNSFAKTPSLWNGFCEAAKRVSVNRTPTPVYPYAIIEYAKRTNQPEERAIRELISKVIPFKKWVAAEIRFKCALKAPRHPNDLLIVMGYTNLAEKVLQAASQATQEASKAMQEAAQEIQKQEVKPRPRTKVGVLA